ncbi:PREDICTED: telomerase protein component 1-like [Priapulus caudatus]|uniref:Telomerase protein component 1-like n=1 Tax=Priapulus caudatus TaxID=37621 RepID=A0ABM1EC13_PRICU|nr:PREDICTED: telomerase protein component 1-like [Priapulus caudatus]
MFIVQSFRSFSLQLALYSRCVLNQRSVANFLLAYGSCNRACRPFLKKYYKASIRLPSDWLNVAEQCQVFGEEGLTSVALPSALRKVMATKFSDFDAYQLAKYNKGKKKKKKKKGKKTSRPEDLVETGESVEETKRKKTFNLKQMIRALHLCEPVEHVMCIIGKRYPDNWDKFIISKLPGTYDETRAGKRMKLPVPETWETQISARGNKAVVWETLIDKKKLPFMAMLRNLRNMIQVGVSDKHHACIIRKLTDPQTVIHSRQFPFRFFSAYDALQDLENQLENQESASAVEVQYKQVKSAKRKQGTQKKGAGNVGRGGAKGQPGAKKHGTTKSQPWYINNGQQEKMSRRVQYDSALINRYRKALDTAVKIATVYNTDPIPGSTIIFCDLGPGMDVPAMAAKGLGKTKTFATLAVLLGLMCKYASEQGQMVVYGAANSVEVELKEGSILDNVNRILKLADWLNCGPPSVGAFPCKVLHDLIGDRKQIDNIIVVSNGIMCDYIQCGSSSFQAKYRRLVNPNLIYAYIDVSGHSGILRGENTHDRDIFLTGFSDQILRYICNRGDSGQLIQVENIDRAYELCSSEKKPQLEALTEEADARSAKLTYAPLWRTIRVFISSTFKDMHGERDLLTRFVFPELRARARERFVNVYEVDLRWGISETAATDTGSLELCLSEASQCQLFVGMLGERYGWTPASYDVSDRREFDWLKGFVAGASVTELEMQHSVLRNHARRRGTAIFLLRDGSYEKEIPKKYQSAMCVENADCAVKVAKLKKAIRASGHHIYDGYPCKWGGVVDGKPIVAGLELFGAEVLNNLWKAILDLCCDETETTDQGDQWEWHHGQHTAQAEFYRQAFVGRRPLLQTCLNTIVACEKGAVVLAGKPGSGKSAVMSELLELYHGSDACKAGSDVISHFLEAVPGSTGIHAMLTRLCHELTICDWRQFADSTVPVKYENLVAKFGKLIAETAQQTSSPLVVFIDGLDLLDDTHQARNLHWLPDPLPENVVFVVSVNLDSDLHIVLKERRAHEVIVEHLDIWDRAKLVRQTLASHGKTLDESAFSNQMKVLVSKREAGQPLFLKLACEELRVFGLFAKVSAKLRSLPQTTPKLLQDILQRLETEHTHEMIATTLQLVYFARNGLLETELHYLLSYHFNAGESRNKSRSKDAACESRNVYIRPDQMIAPVVLSRLLHALHGFLRVTGTERILRLAHAAIGAAVNSRYVRSLSANKKQELHRLLASIYLQEADPARDGSWKGLNSRAFTALPYHLMLGGCHVQLERMLCNLNFLHKKFQLGLGAQLLQDFAAQASGSPASSKQQPAEEDGSRVQQYQAFVTRHQHILSSCPLLTWQYALNEPDTSPLRDDLGKCAGLSPSQRDAYLMLNWMNRPQYADPCSMTLTGFHKPITCLAVSSDGVCVVSGGTDCILRIINLTTGQEESMFVGHAHTISGVCFAGTGVVCSASLDNTLSLWNLSHGTRLHVLKGHSRRVSACAADVSGKLLASAGWDCQLKIWDVRQGKLVTTFLEKRPINAVAFHPEGDIVGTAGWSSVIQLYDIVNQKRIAIVRGHMASVRAMTFSPDGKYMASSALDCSVNLWAAKTGTMVGNLSGHHLPVNSLLFSRDGQQLVTVSDDHTAKLWSGHIGKEVLCLKPPVEARDSHALCVTLNDSGSRVAVGYHNGHVRIFCVKTGLLMDDIHRHASPVRCLAFLSTDLLVSGSEDHTAKVNHRHRDVVTEQLLTGHKGAVVAVAAADSYIVTASEDFTAYVYPGASSLSTSKGKELAPLWHLCEHTGPVTCCNLSPDGRRVVTGSRDMSVIIWDLAGSDPTRPEHVIPEAHRDWITCCAWSNVGNYLVTGSNDFTLKLWDVAAVSAENVPKYHFTGHESAINAVAYKSGCVVSASHDGTVKVWSHKGVEMTTLYGHSERVNSCDLFVFPEKAVSVTKSKRSMDWAAEMELSDWKEEYEKKDTKEKQSKPKYEDVIVVSAGDDGTARVWRPLEGNELMTLDGHSDRVLAVTMTNKEKIVTSSLDCSVRVWQAVRETMQDQHRGEVTCVAASGKYAVTGGRDGLVRLWSIASMQCISKAKVSERTVTSLCFSIKSRLMIGSADGVLREFTIDNVTDQLSLSRQLHIFHTPITTIATVTMNTDKNPAVIMVIVAQQNGQVSLVYADDTLMTCRDSELMFDCVLCVDSDRDMIVCSTDNGTIALCYLKSTDQKKPKLIWPDEESNSESWTTIQHLSAGKEIFQNWVLACCCDSNRGEVYAGDSEGYLTVFRRSNSNALEKNFFSRKVHDGAITCMTLLRSHCAIATGSDDKTIKLLNLSTWKQVGQFYAKTEVTSLCSCNGTLIAGDKQGRTIFLQPAKMTDI